MKSKTEGLTFEHLRLLQFLLQVPELSGLVDLHCRLDLFKFIFVDLSFLVVPLFSEQLVAAGDSSIHVLRRRGWLNALFKKFIINF